MPDYKTVAFFIFLQLSQNIGCYAECNCGKQSEDSVGETVLKYGAVAGVALVATPFVLSAVGFASGGILAGSAAAGFQSTWFGGTISGISGWIFSGLQSAGAGGLGLAGKAAVISSSVKIYDTITGEQCNC